MRVDIFRGIGRVFGFTESGGEEKLPPQYGPWVAFKTLELVRDEAQPDRRACPHHPGGNRLTSVPVAMTTQLVRNQGIGYMCPMRASAPVLTRRLAACLCLGLSRPWAP